MKKIFVAIVLTACSAFGLYAQGTLDSITYMFNSDSITTLAPNATDPATASTWYNGDIQIEFFYASKSSVSQSQVNGINSLNGSGFEGAGSQALEMLYMDGFSLVSATTLHGNTAGPISYYVNNGFLTDGPDRIGLLSPVPTGGSGWLAIYAVIPDGPLAYGSSVLVWSQNNFGGNPNSTPIPGIPSNVQPDPLGVNLVLDVVPEPGTLALAGIGGLAFYLLGRKK